MKYKRRDAPEFPEYDIAIVLEGVLDLHRQISALIVVRRRLLILGLKFGHGYDLGT